MAGDVHLSLLDQVQIASPCSARWEDMQGDDVSRFCGQCELRVYNLSAMTRSDAEAFLVERAGSGRMCGRLYRRSDGTILTKDCPVGLAAIRARARRTAVRIAAAFVALVSATAFAQWRSTRHDQYPLSDRASMCEFGVFSRIAGWVRSPRFQMRSGRGMIMGKIAMPAMRTWSETLTNSDDQIRQYE